ncbi:MAG: HAD-IA family hydrolase [Reyranella sp.]|jgi:phosphoglycolate phosphatase|uniref:HAD-IA family hydrolase n=1 Tax=Reyranella sp. TaxID=1929291 RepID=UPI001AC99AC8|nr:HAD-IA family hydrolase [Reyranella sp.]MBN9537575.1 HAD-IA family hydrolase [Alphaproteobacteria bacterium]MBR2819333.1 HAD-IA family hydrolase [Reyranella sp.]
MDTDKLITSRFDTVIYDLDGTLIDSAKDMEVAVSRVLTDHGLPPVTDDDVRIFMGQGSKVTMGKAFAKYGRPLNDAALSAVTREFVRYYEADPVSHTTAFAGVAEVVARFARLGLKQGVCTNKFEKPSRMILEHLELMPPISDVAGADSFPVRKPDPRHILMLLERMGCDPRRAVMIGDSIHDAEAARGANIPAVLVSWGYTTRPASELGADAVIDRFDALPAALGELAGVAAASR